MTDNPLPPPPDRDTDRGYIVVMTGLLLVPIIAFTALAVDVSSWYSRSNELQRSADAAALAGVVWMPSLYEAGNHATLALGRNGIVDGDDDITVSTGYGNMGNSFKVCLRDNSVTQYFGGFLSAPTVLERCAVAQYNLPLEIGSPQNSFGGIKSAYSDPGATNSSTPRNGDLDMVPTNATSSSACYRLQSQSGSGSRRRYTYYVYKPTYQGTQTFSTTMSPACTWSWPPDVDMIRSDMNPGYWASIEAPGTDAVQGDRYMPECYGRGVVSQASDCSGYANPDNNPNGHYYTLKIHASNPYVFLQVLSASPSCISNSGVLPNNTGDSCWNNNDWTVHFEVYEPDDTPWDISDNPAMGAGQCGGGAGSLADNTGSWSIGKSDPNFVNKWRTLCRISPPGPTALGQYYVLRVWATGSDANASNSYALRAIAATGTSVDPITGWPANAMTSANQPALSAWEHMSIVVNQDASATGGQANFFLAKVAPGYAGKTLVIELYDSAEGSQSITVNRPAPGTGLAQIQQGCEYTSRKLVNVSGYASGTRGAGGVIGAGNPSEPKLLTGDCIVPTRNSSGEYYNGRLLEIRMQIPQDYANLATMCDETVRPGQPQSGDQGCWWSISYKGTGSITDATTWGARIEGDPVRLIE